MGLNEESLKDVVSKLEHLTAIGSIGIVINQETLVELVEHIPDCFTYHKGVSENPWFVYRERSSEITGTELCPQGVLLSVNVPLTKEEIEFALKTKFPR